MADWRYPFNPGLNQSANLPSSFGPPNQSSQIQGAIGSFMDPILAKILQQQATERAQNINEKLITLGEAYKPGVAAAAPAAPGAAVGNTATPEGGRTAAGSPAGDDPGGAQGRGTSTASTGIREEVRQTARQIFAERGIDPDVAERVIRQESGFNPGAVGDKGKSFGVAQLYTGGGLGNVALEQGLDPRDPSKWREHLTFMADTVKRDGWRQWYGARDVGISRWQGIGEGGTAAPTRTAAAPATTPAAPPPALTPAPAPQAAPQTAFAPNVAPAPTPQAAAAVAAPAGRPGEIPFQQPQGPPRVLPSQAGPAPQTQAPQQAMPQEQTQVSEAEAQQQEVIRNVGQGTQQLQQRLDAERQAGQRTRVASLDPSAGISPALPNIGLGEGIPGMGGGPGGPPVAMQAAIDPSVPAPRMVPTTRERPIEPPPPPPPAPSAAAPGGGTAGPPPPPAPRPAVAPPVQVAQAQIIPPTVTDQRGQRPISNEQARELLRMARTPEEVAAVAQHIMKTREAPAMVPNRFRLENGMWIDSLTGETRVAGGRASDVKGRDTVEVEGPGGVKRRMQWNPATERYDIPIDGGPAPTGPAPPTKEQFEQEYKLRDKFESDPETRRYAVATNAYGQMRSSANSGNGVGDISLIYQYMKMLDPDTGVREGEYANAAATGGIPDRIVNWYNKAVSGERLSDKQRKDFVDEAGRLLQVRHSNVAKTAEKVRRNATAYGLSPDRVAQIEDYKFDPWSSPTGPDGRPRNDPGGSDPERAATAPGSPANPIPIPDDPKAAQKTMRALPKGKWFVMPDGTVDRKP